MLLPLQVVCSKLASKARPFLLHYKLLEMRYKKTQALMGATRLASGKFNVHTLTKGLQTALITWLFMSLCLNFRRGTRRPH